MDINEYLEKKKELENIIKTNGKQLLSSLFEDLFKNSDYKEVRWVQYTPYFNDGEACVFSVGNCNLLTEKMINKDYDDDEYDDYIDRGHNCWNMPEDEDTKKLIRDFNAKFQALEDVFHMTFGDHSQIRAFVKDGEVTFEVEEYDHE